MKTEGECEIPGVEESLCIIQNLLTSKIINEQVLKKYCLDVSFVLTEQLSTTLPLK